MELTEAFLQLQPRWHYLFSALCLVVLVYKFSVFLVKRKAVLRSTEAFPGPPGNFLLGHVLEFKQDGTDLFRTVKWARTYPYGFPMWFGPFLCLLSVHHPDYVKTILTSSEPKDEFVYSFLMPWIGDGLLVSKGQKWFRHRRLLTPGFHYDVLKPYVQLMSQSAKTMLDKWESYAKTNENFELFEHVSLMTLDTILQCAFSCKSNCQTEGGTNAYIKAVYELSNIVNFRLRTFPYHSDLIFHLSPHGFKFRKACKVAHSHTEEVIRKRKEALKEETELGRIQAKRYLDFLDILLVARDENQQGLSNEDIRAEVDTFMFEGHDTTASGISFLLYCLACNPEHQKICREEILQVLDGKDTMEWEDLNKIPYTTMCIKEALRLYPPVPGMSRKLTKPVTFFDGRTLPAGFRVGVSVFSVHRNPAVWENPDVFDPLRFLPENVTKRSPHAFVPFSAGPRNCIGQNFAMNELKVVAAMTLKRYQLIEDPDFKPKMVPRLILRSLNGVHIKIKPVEPQV
ncbi:cytochrome P450 4B1 [Kryptolebias marmoratus]|uniref:aromatase n=1 Tax=Kryptolebias marmoratus TaxID=37003 RepID=A0A2L0EBW4_KRYMA|nr:cytochrome P450 4B1 [Kryptolebias marmoratus]AUX14919.1 cytochrome p450 CYP4T17 [Kryptolebias marmoratus]QLC36646.1 cytochrome P450 4B1-like [Kryptolebias hermaphroditus]